MPASGLGLTGETYKDNMILSFVHEKLLNEQIADQVHTALPELKVLYGVGQEGYDQAQVMASGRRRSIVTGKLRIILSL